LTEYHLELMKKNLLTVLKLLSPHLETRCLIIITNYEKEWKKLISNTKYQAYKGDKYPVIKIVGNWEKVKNKVTPLVNKVLSTYISIETSVKQPVEKEKAFISKVKPLYSFSLDALVK